MLGISPPSLLIWRQTHQMSESSHVRVHAPRSSARAWAATASREAASAARRLSRALAAGGPGPRARLTSLPGASCLLRRAGAAWAPPAGFFETKTVSPLGRKSGVASEARRMGCVRPCQYSLGGVHFPIEVRERSERQNAASQSRVSSSALGRANRQYEYST